MPSTVLSRLKSSSINGLYYFCKHSLCIWERGKRKQTGSRIYSKTSTVSTTVKQHGTGTKTDIWINGTE